MQQLVIKPPSVTLRPIQPPCLRCIDQLEEDTWPLNRGRRPQCCETIKHFLGRCRHERPFPSRLRAEEEGDGRGEATHEQGQSGTSAGGSL